MTDSIFQIPIANGTLSVDVTTLAAALANSTFTPNAPPKPIASPDKTTVTAAGPVITDAAGNTWGINTAKQVVVNGVADTSTANVIEVAYVGGKIWHENTDTPNNWYSKTLPAEKWSPPTTTNPVTGIGPALTSKGALLKLFADLRAANKFAIGQHGEIWTSDSSSVAQVMQPITDITAQTGLTPAILCLVVNFATNSYATTLAAAASAAKAWWAKGGIVQFTLYWDIPTANGMVQAHGMSVDAATFHRIVTPGSAENKVCMAFLTGSVWPWLAATIGMHCALWRFETELNGGWNWYGAQAPADEVAMFKMARASADSAGLANSLLWEYNPNSNLGNYTQDYPGSDVIDTVGFDNYDSAANFANDIAAGGMWPALKGLGKPIVLPEFGLIGNNPLVAPNTLDNMDILKCRALAPEVVAVNNWCQGMDLAKQKNAAALMKDPSVVTLVGLTKAISS